MPRFLKRVIFITILNYFFLALFSQDIQKGDTILYWTKDYRLTFTDFRVHPNKDDTLSHDENSKNSLHNLGIINKGIDIPYQTKAGTVVFKIYAGMNKELSWIRISNDSITLKHEQGHFDICEIYARILRREIKKATTMEEAKNIFNKVSDDENVEQDRYDKENTFVLGGITAAWKNAIISRLKELESYEDPIVTLTFKN